MLYMILHDCFVFKAAFFVDSCGDRYEGCRVYSMSQKGCPRPRWGTSCFGVLGVIVVVALPCGFLFPSVFVSLV